MKRRQFCRIFGVVEEKLNLSLWVQLQRNSFGLQNSCSSEKRQRILSGCVDPPWERRCAPLKSRV